jgi:hypothetical protein
MEQRGEYSTHILFVPAYDKRSPSPSKNYGVHGVDINFYLKGPKGALQLLVFTNWQLPQVAKERLAGKYMFSRDDVNALYLPEAADFFIHSSVPLYEGQGIERDSCDWVPEGSPCYLGLNSPAGEKLFDILLQEGSDGFWAAMQVKYEKIFEGRTQ